MSTRLLSTDIVALAVLTGAASLMLPGNLGVASGHAQDPAFVHLPGVVRDFQSSHVDFDVTPTAGYGHYAGNVGFYLNGDRRPVLTGNGYRVNVQWRNSGVDPIPPHLSGSGIAPIIVADTPDVHHNATLDSWDSSAGPYGGENVGPAPAILVGGGMPTIVIPESLTALPNLDDETYDNETISDDLRCHDLVFRNTVQILGDVTILCEGRFTIHNGADVQIMPDSSLTIYMGEGMFSLPHSSLNANTGNPNLVQLLNYGTEEMRVSQPHAEAYARIVSPNAQLRLMPHSEFFGSFVGQHLDMQANSNFHADDMVPEVCGAAMADFAGTAGVYNNGAITSTDTFSRWYIDTPGENLSAAHVITLMRNDSGVYEYLDDAFLPIDGRLFGNDGQSHNYLFTYSFCAEFTFSACSGMFFEFEGADDAWMFVEGPRSSPAAPELGLDLGGVLPGTDQVVELDRLGLTDGETYTMHFFYAQRQTTSATFRLRTNVPLAGDQMAHTVSAAWD